MNRDDPWLCEVNASVGVYAEVPGDRDGMESFIQRADEAMYRCKRRRKRALT